MPVVLHLSNESLWVYKQYWAPDKLLLLAVTLNVEQLLLLILTVRSLAITALPIVKHRVIVVS